MTHNNDIYSKTKAQENLSSLSLQVAIMQKNTKKIDFLKNFVHVQMAETRHSFHCHASPHCEWQLGTRLELWVVPCIELSGRLLCLIKQIQYSKHY